jgi:phage I-like protein
VSNEIQQTRVYVKRNFRQTQSIAIAACAAEINPKVPGEIRLIPAGSFRARDGRPTDVPAWRMDAAIAARVIALAAATTDESVIDYEHQTLNTETNGQPAPAAGWFKALEWREGDGLYAVALRWTDRARAAIEAGEYRYISPVFTFDKKTGEVLAIQMAALTNYAGLDGLTDLIVRAAAKFQTDVTDQENDDMNREQLIKLLGLADNSTDEQINQAIVALKAKAGETEGLKTEVATLKAQTPDPAKFVPVETMKSLQAEVAALRADTTERNVNEVVTAALDAGKLLPAQEPWARELGKKDLAALKSYLETAPAIAALRRTQTDGKGPEGNQGGELDETQLAVCKQLGVSPEDYKKSLADAA